MDFVFPTLQLFVATFVLTICVVIRVRQRYRESVGFSLKNLRKRWLEILAWIMMSLLYANISTFIFNRFFWNVSSSDHLIIFSIWLVATAVIVNLGFRFVWYVQDGKNTKGGSIQWKGP